MAWFDIASNAPWLVNHPTPGQSLAQGAQVGGIISAAMGRRAALQEEARQFDAKMSYQERLEAQTADSVGRMIQDLQAAPTTTDQLNVVNRYAPLAVTPAGDRALGLVGQMLRAKAGVETATARAAAAMAKTSAQARKNESAWNRYDALAEKAPDLFAMLEAENEIGITVDQGGAKIPLFTPEGNWTGVGLMRLNRAVKEAGIQAQDALVSPVSGMEPVSVTKTGKGAISATFRKPTELKEGTMTQQQRFALRILENQRDALQKEMESPSWESQEGLEEFKEAHDAKRKKLNDVNAKIAALVPQAFDTSKERKRVRVRGPQGQSGTVFEDETLPPGWQILP